ncbi:post-transcriptional regulator [Brevibacillus laterosporus]|uniref:post-transcriptional regulator n=1 Tax=Brevibacillus laterosporus TaxID=1465 RepID=UPI001EF2D1FD|nr:post-transcriptional regulator [Brevibacillus laterosporus]MCG7318159.1 post-transcriptional regulator [Brevibacillus laterosporus]
MENKEKMVSFIEVEKYQEMLVLCKSKAEEFLILGYDNITPEEVWDCVISAYKGEERPTLHRLVNDILSLKISKYMNYVMINMYKNNGVI